jgi:DNA replication protein DnaC
MHNTNSHSINEKLYALERARSITNDIFLPISNEGRDKLLCAFALAPTAEALYQLYQVRNQGVSSVEIQEQIEELYELLQILRNHNGAIDVKNLANIHNEDSNTLRNALRESVWYHTHELIPANTEHTEQKKVTAAIGDIQQKIQDQFAWFTGDSADVENMQANTDVHAIKQRQKNQNNRATAYEAEVNTNHTQWFTDCAVKLRKYKRQLRQYGLVLTPTFQRIAEDIVDTNKPFLLYGPPGTGKTELALFVGRKLQRNNLADIRKAYTDNGYTVVSNKDLERMYGEQKKERESFATFCIRIQQEKNIISDSHCTEPVVLSGNKEFDHTKLGVKTRLTTRKTPINTTIETFRALTDELALTPSEQAVVTAYLNAPIQTIDFLGELLQAMKYGQVVIFDEFNAVPHAVMIMLNHLITRKPGDVIHPNAGSIAPFTVHPNFKFIATGNIGPQYEREHIDIAAWNRYGRKVEVQYPTFKDAPELHFSAEVQSAIDSGLTTLSKQTEQYMAQWSDAERTAYRQGGIIQDPVSKTNIECLGTTDNELFEILAAYIVPKKLAGKLPVNWAFELRKLALCANGIHKAYRGDTNDSRFHSLTGKHPSAILEQGVPTLRTLSTIIQRWVADKFNKPLDYYVWQVAVSEATSNKEEREYLAYVYKTIGRFFSDQTVFNADPNTLAQLQFIGRDETDPLAAKLTPPVLQKFTAEDIFTSIYGPGPIEHTLVSSAQEEELSTDEMMRTLSALQNEIASLLQEVKNDPELFQECSFDASFKAQHTLIA